METGVRCSYVADVTGALEKLRQGGSDGGRGRDKNLKEAADRRIRSLSPGLCRSYDWNTTHFYPDIHQIEGNIHQMEGNIHKIEGRNSALQGMRRTVRFASETESSEEEEEEEAEEEELEEKEELEEWEKERGGKGEEWRGDETEEGAVDGEDRKEENEEYVSSSDDFDEWNPSSENEHESDRNAKRGSVPKVEDTPLIQDREEDIQGRRNGKGFSAAGSGKPDPAAHPAKFGVGENKGEKLYRCRMRTEPWQSTPDNDNTVVEDWKNNADDSRWRWEIGGAEHQRKNTVYENEVMPHYDWNQWQFVDAETLPSEPNEESATQQRHNGKSERNQAFKSEGPDDLQMRETTLTRGIEAGEAVRTDDSSSSTRERQRSRQKPKPQQKGQCMITHFDHPWPVSEFGSDYPDGRKVLPTEVRGQRSPAGKSLRSILKHNKTTDAAAPTYSISGSDLSNSPSIDPIQPQWNTLPNLHRFVGTSASCSAADDEADDGEDDEAWKATQHNNSTDAPEKRWKSESFLFLQDARSQSRGGRRKRFVIDYRRPCKGHVTFTGSGERRSIGPFTLNEFERCLEIPAGQPDAEEVREAVEQEAGRSPEMEEIRTEEESANRLPIDEETVNGKDDLTSGRDPSSDLFWLFHRVSRRIDGRRGTDPKCNYAGFPPQNRSVHPGDCEKSAFETSKYPENDSRKEYLKWKTEPAAVRQQYRWSTAIREPHARILLDQWNVEPPLSLMTPRNRYRIVHPEHLVASHRTTDVDRIGLRRNNDSPSAIERAFTITGQPKPRSPLKDHSNAGRQPSSKYAVVGISHRDIGTVHPVTYSADWQNESTSARFEDVTPSLIVNRKHRYLRERVLTESSVDSYPELTDPTPADLILSRSGVAHRSLQNLEQLQLTDVASKHKPMYREMWDSYTSKSSLLSLPSDLLLRQRNVDMSSVGSQDSVERRTADVRKPRGGQRVPGRRGDVYAVVSPGRKSSPSQTRDTSGEESTSDWNSGQQTTSKGNLGLRPFEGFDDTEKTSAAVDHRPRYFRKSRRVQQTPRAVKARHEMKARRVKSRDWGKEYTPSANWNRHSFGPSYSSESFSIGR